MIIKHLILFIALIVLQYSASSQSCSNLFFSEYIEGASNNKAIEVFNPTQSIISLTDYVIYRFNNGSPAPTDSLHMQGAIAPGGVYVAGNPSAITSIAGVSDTLHTITFFTGDDAMALYQKSTSTYLDIIGVIGMDPGINWIVGTGATSEYTLVRKININGGDLSWTSSVNGWDIYPQNTATYIGSHTMTPCCANSTSTLNLTQCNSLVSPSSNYTYTLSGTYLDTIPNSLGCDSIITLNVIINSPSSISQTLTICSGQNIIVGPSSYSITGLYSNTLTAINNCDSIVTTNLIVNTLPIITVNSGTICNGQSFTITPSGATTYTYSSGSDVVMPTSNESYTVTGTDASGCVSTDVISNITVNALPTVIASTSNTLMCTGETATLSAMGATTYTWSTAQTTMSIAVSPTVTETYTLMGADANGCSNTTTFQQEVSLCTGVQSLESKSILSVYPNPNNGLFTINLNKADKVIVTNTLGQIVLTNTFDFGKHNLDIANESNGVYFVKVIANGKQQTIKILKQ